MSGRPLQKLQTNLLNKWASLERNHKGNNGRPIGSRLFVFVELISMLVERHPFPQSIASTITEPNSILRVKLRASVQLYVKGITDCEGMGKPCIDRRTMIPRSDRWLQTSLSSRDNLGKSSTWPHSIQRYWGRAN